VTSPAGGQYECACPRCSASFQNERDLNLNYSQYVPAVGSLTIGSVRVDTNDERQNSYMCQETGVGSGSIYYEGDLFHTRDEAMVAAEAKAAAANLETEWVVKQYDRAVKLSDYQLSSAMIEAARATKVRNEVDISMLFDDLRDCETIEQVREKLDGFKFREAA
jgi:hypothetical protein